MPEFDRPDKVRSMALEVHGFDNYPKSVEPAPQPAVAAPAAPAAPAPPQATPGASVPAPSQAVQPAPAAPSITAFGRQFKSPEELEGYTRHVVRSAEGRIRSELQNELRAAPPQPTTSPAATPPEPEPEGAYDVKTYTLVKTQYGEEAAENYRSHAIAEHNRKVVQESLSESLAPYRATEEQRQMETEATQLFSRAMSAVGKNGQPLIPELKSEAAAEAIVQIWQRLPKEFAMTPEGVWHAAMAYRGAVGSFQTMPPPPVQGPSGVSIDASHAVTPGFVPAGQPQQPAIPRPTTVNPATGERLFVQ